MKCLKFLLLSFLLPVPAYAADGGSKFPAPIDEFLAIYAEVAFVYALIFPVLFLVLWRFKSKFCYSFLVCSVFFEWISFWIIVAFFVAFLS